MDLRLLFMGTPDFAVPSLERLIENGFKPVAVVTGQDKPRGRGRRLTPTPIKEAADRHGIPTLQPASVKDPEFAEEVAKLDVDLIVVVAFRILPPTVFTAARIGAFNLHGSLLPRFRGAAPIQRALMEGVDETGVTTFFLKEKVDTGNVILKKSTPVGPDETGGELHDRLAVIGADAVLETVQLIAAGDVNPQPQDDARATPAPKIHKEDCRIDWSMSSEQVHNHVRALSPYPAAFCFVDEARVKVFRTRLHPAASDQSAGTVISTDGGLVVSCGSGSVEILALQHEGRRRTDGASYVNGYGLAVGKRLS